ncbi:MAG: ribosome maturation factor RimM [Desulfomonilaceae bacterium]
MSPSFSRFPILMSEDELVVIGRVQKPFGIRGEVKIQAYTQTFDAFENSEWLEIKHKRFVIKQIRFHKGSVLVLFEGIKTPETAAILSGQLVHTLESNLPPKDEDEYYYHELIGMEVFTKGDQFLGKITDIMVTGANDVLIIFGEKGEILLPFIDEVALEIDLKAKRMLVDPLEGLIPDA